MKEAALFKIIIEKMGTTFELEKILGLVCKEIQKLFKVDRVAIGHLDLKTYEWVVFTEYKTVEKMLSFKDTEHLIKVAPYLKESIIKNGENIVVDDIHESNLPDFYKEAHEKIGTRSILDIPIKKGDKFWGILGLFQNSCYRHWTKKEIKFLHTIVEYISIAIQRAELYAITKHQAEREALLRKVVETIRSTLDINEVLTIICDEVGKLFNVQRATIIEVEYPSEKKWFARREYISSSEIKGLKNAKFDKRTVTYWRQITQDKGMNLIIDNIEKSNVPDYFRKDYKNLGVKSILGTPIKRENEKWGLIALSEYNHYRHWSEEEINLLNTISDQVFIAIKQAKLYTTTKNQADREALLRKIVEKIRSTLDINKIEKSIAKEVGKLFKADRCYIVDYNSERDAFLPVKKTVEYLSSTDVKSVTGYDWSELKVFINIIKQEQEVNFEDVKDFIKKYNLSKEEKEIVFPREYGLKSTYNIPIIFAGKLLGIFCIDYTRQHVKLTEENLNFIRTLATQTGIAMYQARLYKSTKELADRESLLRSTVSTIRSTLELSDIKNKIVNEIGKVLKPDRAYIAEYDQSEDRNLFVDEYSEYLSSPDLKSFVDFNFSESSGFKQFYEMHENQKDIIFNNLDKFLEENNLKEGSDSEKFLKSFNVQAFAAICIIYKNQFLGILSIQYTKPRNFMDEDLEFIKTLASQAGVAIYQSRLYESIKKTAEKEKLLKEIIIEIKLSHSMEQVYKYILKKFADLFHFKHTFFVEISEFTIQNPTIKYEFNKNTQSYEPQNMIFPQICIDEIINIINTQNKMMVNNTKNYHPENQGLQEFFKKNNIKSFYMSAITKYNNERNTFGAIVLCSDEIKSFTHNELSLFEEILNSVATVLWEISKREEIDELRNNFILTLAHDLQVPLVGERRALEFIMSIPPGQLLDKYKHIIAEIIKNNINLSKFLAKLVDSYNYELTRKKLFFIETDFSLLIKDVAKSLISEADEKSIQLDIELEENLPFVFIDKDEVRKVIYTLLENAVTYTHKNGHIIVKSSIKKNFINICILDNGPGIPEEIQKYLFKRYEMALAIEQKIGAGMGLYLSKQIVEAHKGKIEFTSKLNEGTTFCFTLPIS